MDAVNRPLLPNKGNKFISLDVKGALGSMKKLKMLDIANNTQLKKVNCQFNTIQQIKASQCTALETLKCGYNNKKLTSLNLYGCTTLKNLDITNSNLAIINVAQFTNLETFVCDNTFNGSNFNPIYNFSTCTHLRHSDCLLAVSGDSPQPVY